LQQEIDIAKKQYQQTVLLSIFDFVVTINSGKELLDYLLEHSTSFNPESVTWTEELLVRMDKLQETAKKFQNQLQFLFQQPESPEENQPLQERIKAAATYFVTEIGSVIQFIQQSPAVTDSRLYSKEYNDSIKEVFAQLAMKKFILEGFNGEFDIELFHRRKQKFVLPSVTMNAYAGASQKRTESPRPALHHQLRKVRETICAKKNLPIYIVAGSNTIDEMALYLPQTFAELRKISGFGDAKVKQYGQQFLDVIVAYSIENNLSSLIYEKLPKQERKVKNELTNERSGKTGNGNKKGDTRAISFRLFKEGKSIAEIAKERNLAVSTIETHLTKFVRQREIKLEEILSREKLILIEAALQDFKGSSITPIKHQLNDEISFGEIRLVMAGLGIELEKTTD
jgi:hypothetical protein